MRIRIFVACLTILFIVPMVCMYQSCFVRPVLTDACMIDDVMSFPMVDIVKRCQKDFGYTDDDMVMLERELKRYLILCMMKENVDISVDMYSEDVDNLWHSFILFTKDYAYFCNKYAQHFIHHVPRVDDTFSHDEIVESRHKFRAFIENYEKVFGEEIHSIWLLDRCA